MKVFVCMTHQMDQCKCRLISKKFRTFRDPAALHAPCIREEKRREEKRREEKRREEKRREEKRGEERFGHGDD
ncbi:hypothetical protein HI914_03788 [Erysiphe necator]|nr:hypothetical protein HI914_03788 [Erysiphe necator]